MRGQEDMGKRRGLSRENGRKEGESKLGVRRRGGEDERHEGHKKEEREKGLGRKVVIAVAI